MTEYTSKRCKVCKDPKPISEFYRDKKAIDGHRGLCKNCDNKRKRQWELDNWEQYTQNGIERADRWRQDNVERYHATNIQWNKDNPKKIKQSEKTYRTNHPERVNHKNQRREARIRNLPYTLTEAEWQIILADFDGCCAYCGTPQSEVEFTFAHEHIVPPKQGGGYTKHNIVPACIHCNSRKGERTPEQAGMKILKYSHH